MFHRHKWEVVSQDSVGRFEKQEGQGEASVFYCTGKIERCLGCLVRRLVPHQPGLLPVEEAA